MAPPSKTTPEQKVYLEENIDAYRETQKHGAFSKLWPRVYKGWFDRWPAKEDMEIQDEAMRKKVHQEVIHRTQKYIRVWFRNHSVPGGRSAKEETVKIPKTTCCLQLQEYYSKKYYSTRIASNVADAIAALGKKEITEKERLHILRTETDKAFKNESDQFRKDITMAHKAYQKEFAAAKKREKEGELNPTPATYAAGIKLIEPYFKQFSAQAASSGWSFVLLAGGPDPSNGGRISTRAYHNGSNLLGFAYSEHDPSFATRQIPAFGNFVTTCYTQEECDSRALPSQSSVNAAIQSPQLYVMSPSPSPAPEPLPAAFTLPTQPQQPAKPIADALPEVPEPHSTPVLPILPAAPVIPAQTPSMPIPVIPAQTSIAVVPVDHTAPGDSNEFSWDGFDFDFQFGLNSEFLGEIGSNSETPSMSVLYGPYPTLSAELQGALAPAFVAPNSGVMSNPGMDMVTPAASLGAPFSLPTASFQPGPSSFDPASCPLPALPTQLPPTNEAWVPTFGRAPAPDMAAPPGPATVASPSPPVPVEEAVLPPTVSPSPPVPVMEAVLPSTTVPAVTGVAAAIPTEKTTVLAPLSVQVTGRKRRSDEVDPKFILSTKRMKRPQKRVEIEPLVDAKLAKAKGKENQ